MLEFGSVNPLDAPSSGRPLCAERLDPRCDRPPVNAGSGLLLAGDGRPDGGIWLLGNDGQVVDHHDGSRFASDPHRHHGQPVIVDGFGIRRPFGPDGFGSADPSVRVATVVVGDDGTTVVTDDGTAATTAAHQPL